MAFKWIALLCLVSIAVAQVEDSVPIATAQVGSEPAASDLPQGPTQGQDSAAVNPGLPQEGPIADIVFTGGECAQKCMRLLGDLNEVADPKNIEKVIKDLDGLCERYQNAKQCAAPCPQEELDSFNRATGLLQFTCVEKREMLQQLGPCMTQNQDSSLKTCEQQCGSLDDLIKVENGSGPTDPQQIFAKMGPVCNGLKCTIRCMKSDMNQKCAGAGDFIRDVAVKQVEEAGNQLMKDVNDPKNPMAEHLAKVLKETLPSDCAYMLAPQQFRDAVDAAGNSTESNPPPPNVPQIDQPIANPESAPEASITTVNLETTTVNLETTTVNLETTTAGSPSSGSQNMTEDNRTIEKEPVNSQNASGNVIASALTVFFVILFACF